MIVVIGGGLAGLSAGYLLSKSGRQITVIEKDSTVGGLAKTVDHNGFRFDLGGHRFLTENKEVENFVRDILQDDFLVVPRKSKIYMSGKYFDYPLKPANAIFGLGVSSIVRIVAGYLAQKTKNRIKPSEVRSLEDWVIDQFGREMFELYFRQYSEKVWGMDCNNLSKEWVSQRIKGLSLWEAVKNAFFKFSGKEIATLADSFIYPKTGIGQIAESLKKGIENRNHIMTDTRVMQINHEDFSVRDVSVMSCKDICDIEGDAFISSMPLTNLINALHPSAPDDVLEAASRLRYRDLLVVSVMLDRERATDLTWMYLPEKDIPIGRIHEPKNWSRSMAPYGMTHIVCEYFCCRGDKIWNSTKEDITALTVKHLSDLGLINKGEIIDSCVIKAPNAYPIYEIGYEKHYSRIIDYLRGFKNLHITGRGGMFRYLNMDHAIEAGLTAAGDIIKGTTKMEMHKKWRHSWERSGEAATIIDKFEIASLRPH